MSVSPVMRATNMPRELLQAVAFPGLTLIAAGVGVTFPSVCAPLGTLPVFQSGLSLLMLSMGLSLSPADLGRALKSPKELALNALLCFGAMPMVALALARALKLPQATAAGLVLLGSVSGGQASNLCALLAGGDLALSVVLTVSTTLLGAIATPALVRVLLGTAVGVDAVGVLRSIVGMVVLPLAAGLAIGRGSPGAVARIRPALPRLGIAALLLLVLGGSANASALLVDTAFAWKAHAASVALPIAGGAAALVIARLARLDERAVRTLTIEAAIKSPTLAFVLARKHFTDAAVALPPAASMVWLATIGALASSVWSRCAPPTDGAHDYEG